MILGPPKQAGRAADRDRTSIRSIPGRARAIHPATGPGILERLATRSKPAATSRETLSLGSSSSPASSTISAGTGDRPICAVVARHARPRISPLATRESYLPLSAAKVRGRLCSDKATRPAAFKYVVVEVQPSKAGTWQLESRRVARPDSDPEIDRRTRNEDTYLSGNI